MPEEVARDGEQRGADLHGGVELLQRRHQQGLDREIPEAGAEHAAQQLLVVADIGHVGHAEVEEELGQEERGGSPVRMTPQHKRCLPTAQLRPVLGAHGHRGRRPVLDGPAARRAANPLEGLAQQLQQPPERGGDERRQAAPRAVREAVEGAEGQDPREPRGWAELLAQRAGAGARTRQGRLAAVAAGVDHARGGDGGTAPGAVSYRGLLVKEQ
mmetsp:Transcript_43489/g.123050  ORF Transcript_43489/g.123050 Transcript_43489/m.123050 type:complete len:214 (+) Transcript_43489:1304-1945(+)